MKNQTADAIVVLGAGSYLKAPEYGADTVGEAGLFRLRYAARLQRETGRPVLVTGGKPQGNTLSEAEQMKAVLENEFHVPVKWTEGESNNTLENARFTQRILARQASSASTSSPMHGICRALLRHSALPVST